MSERTNIAWCDHTWSPWWGCEKVNPDCTNCYAERLDARTGGDHWGPGKPRREMSGAHWNEPLRWNRAAEKAGERRRVFPSMCDPFDPKSPRGDREAMWDLIRATRWLDWLLLTKRPQNVAAMLPADWGDGWRNVWLGVSVGHPGAASFLDVLRAVPAALRWISAEPLHARWVASLAGFAWIVIGGESGPRRREMSLDDARALFDQARRDGLAVFMKQDSGLYPGGRGRIPDELWVRELPSGSAQ